MSSNAFTPPSVGLMVISAANLEHRLPAIAAFADGMLSDVFVRDDCSLALADKVRATPRPDGTKLRCQYWAVPGDDTPAVFAQRVNDNTRRLQASVAELNIERTADAELAPYITTAYRALRVLRPTFKFSMNVGSYKGFGLVGIPFVGDPNVYASEQNYYGDMSPTEGDEVLRDLLEHGVPSLRARVCYGAAGPVGWTAPGRAWLSARHCTLGTLYYNGQLVRRLRSGLIYQDDLLAEVGLL